MRILERKFSLCHFEGLISLFLGFWYQHQEVQWHSDFLCVPSFLFWGCSLISCFCSQYYEIPQFCGYGIIALIMLDSYWSPGGLKLKTVNSVKFCADSRINFPCCFLSVYCVCLCFFLVLIVQIWGLNNKASNFLVFSYLLLIFPAILFYIQRDFFQLYY